MPTVRKQTKSTRELAAEKLFRSYKSKLIRGLGRGPLMGDQIDTIGRGSFGADWRGVFSQEDVPMPLRPGYYVVNSSYTANSPGYHWMALYVSGSGRPYYYDSYARSAAQMLHRLRKRRVAGAIPVIEADRSDAEQRGASAVCGQLSISWLLVVRDLSVRDALLI